MFHEFQPHSQPQPHGEAAVILDEQYRLEDRGTMKVEERRPDTEICQTFASGFLLRKSHPCITMSGLDMVHYGLPLTAVDSSSAAISGVIS